MIENKNFWLILSLVSIWKWILDGQIYTENGVLLSMKYRFVVSKYPKMST